MLLTLHTTADCTMTVPVFLVGQVPEFLTATKIALGHGMFTCMSSIGETY
jgi:hypothetical protein